MLCLLATMLIKEKCRVALENGTDAADVQCMGVQGSVSVVSEHESGTTLVSNCVHSFSRFCPEQEEMMAAAEAQHSSKAPKTPAPEKSSKVSKKGSKDNDGEGDAKGAKDDHDAMVASAVVDDPPDGEEGEEEHPEVDAAIDEADIN